MLCEKENVSLTLEWEKKFRPSNVCSALFQTVKEPRCMHDIEVTSLLYRICLYDISVRYTDHVISSGVGLEYFPSITFNQLLQLSFALLLGVQGFRENDKVQPFENTCHGTSVSHLNRIIACDYEFLLSRPFCSFASFVHSKLFLLTFPFRICFKVKEILYGQGRCPIPVHP